MDQHLVSCVKSNLTSQMALAFKSPCDFAHSGNFIVCIHDLALLMLF